MADGRKRPWDQRKRRAAAAGSGGDEGIELVDFRAAAGALEEYQRQLLLPVASSGVYFMRELGEKERLARDLWKGDFAASAQLLREQNVQLVEVLRAKLSNSSDATPIQTALI